MKVRLTGLPAEVETAAARIAGVVTVLETSRPYPRRGTSALVSLYLDVTLDTALGPRAEEQHPPA
ncbi:hypothetical protein [Spirillospora sp. CA-128828]|uniref:hypothetical protein n=1 Tax=Spirillospora sp. CA-128828 TaxID=3240033 RepID=UPI003D8E6837